MSLHTPFKVDIANPVPPNCNQIDTIVGTGQSDQIGQIIWATGKGVLSRCPSMSSMIRYYPTSSKYLTKELWCLCNDTVSPFYCVQPYANTVRSTCPQQCPTCDWYTHTRRLLRFQQDTDLQTDDHLYDNRNSQYNLPQSMVAGRHSQWINLRYSGCLVILLHKTE